MTNGNRPAGREVFSRQMRFPRVQRGHRILQQYGTHPCMKGDRRSPLQLSFRGSFLGAGKGMATTPMRSSAPALCHFLEPLNALLNRWVG